MRTSEVVRKARRERQNVSAFKALRATPAVAPFALPAGARLGFRRASIVAEDTTAATLTGPSTRTIKTPALAAGEIMVLDFAERGTLVTPAFGFDVMLDVGQGRFEKIGEGA